ncbi:MAG: tyrosine--tRNA ligase [Planctomycetes bacterium]|nr:tyrosine--tRNA ligase [Planctomycetota bacterium]
MFVPVEDQLRVIRRGIVDLVEEKELAEKLARSRREGRPLRVKLGIDPSSPDIHLGHTVVLRKLRDFQSLGHQAIVLWGTATAMVGDPTGRNKTRPQLTREQVEVNQRTYRDQVGRVLDMSTAEERENGEWFDKMSFIDCVKLAAGFTVARILERDSFAERFGAGEAISIHELIYPLMQGHDSVELRADVELGGTDQLFNLHRGRDLQERAGQEKQVLVTTPLLVGLDGHDKMSKSLGNHVGVTDPPAEMIGKVMSLPDTPMRAWFTLLTDLTLDAIDALLAGHPRAAKMELARRVATAYWGEAAANDAVAQFDRVFKDGGKPASIQEIAVPGDQLDGGAITLAALLVTLGFCTSRSEARRLVAGGGVRVDDQKQPDPLVRLGRGRYLVNSGKRNWAYAIVP